MVHVTILEPSSQRCGCISIPTTVQAHTVKLYIAWKKGNKNIRKMGNLEQAFSCPINCCSCFTNKMTFINNKQTIELIVFTASV